MNLEESVRQTKEQWSADPQLKIEREQVIDKYSEIFKLDNIDKLTPEIFKKFLRRDENKHWSKLDRVGGNLVKNMPKLKSGLKILLDESIPLPERIKRIRDKTSVDYTPNLANAIYTPILLITNPKKYPVVNLVVVEALDELGLYSKKDWTTNEEEWDSIPQMQQIVMETALKHDLDLWQIDWAWWRISRNDDTPNSKSVNADVDFWLVGSGRDAERQDMWREFLTSNIVGVGWNNTGDVSNLSRTQIKSIFKNKKIKQGADTLYDFTQIKPNDIVFVNDGKQGFFGIGKVIGPYRFDSQYTINHHVFPVEWITTEYILVKPDRIPGNPNAGVSRIVKGKEALFKYLNGVSEKSEDYTEVKGYAKILERSKQIIFFGAPGTGKTHHADLLAKYFTKDPAHSTMTFRSAAIQILSKNGKPMHYTKICEQALTQKLVQTDGKTPEETLRTRIAEDMKKNGSHSIFRKTDIATYDINQEKFEELKIIESNEVGKNPFVERVTFHPSYSYEDFIEGIKPSTENGQISYNLEDGIFKKICEKASADNKNNYVLLIDEINRGNVSKIFGELISILETSYREKPITLAYSKLPFSIPKNLYVIGTMNTADRSLVQIDTALRRRFSFIELMPKPELLTKTIKGISLKKLLEKLNDRIVASGLREKQVGHTYLLFVETVEDLQFIFSNQIIPLLQDYFFNDYKKLEKKILSKDFIDSDKMIVKEEWKKNSNVFIDVLKQTFSL